VIHQALPLAACPPDPFLPASLPAGCFMNPPFCDIHIANFPYQREVHIVFSQDAMDVIALLPPPNLASFQDIVNKINHKQNGH
jgi:hypothetical protein